MQSPSESPTRSGGVVAALTSACAFGVSGTIVTPMLAAGWSPAAAVVFRLGIGALALAPWAIASMRGRWHRWRGMLLTIAIYGALAVAGVQFAYFQAVRTIPVAVALLLEYLGVVLVLVWLRFGRRQPVAWPAWAGAAVALTGMVLVLQLDRIGHIDPAGVGWGLLAAVGLAAYFILADSTPTRRRRADEHPTSPTGRADEHPTNPTGRADEHPTNPTGRADEHPTSQPEPVPPPMLAAGGLALGALGLLALCGLRVLPWNITTAPLTYGPLTVPWWAAMLALGGVSGAVSYATGIFAVRRLGPRLAAFLALVELLVATATAAIVLGQSLNAIQLVGAAVVVAGIVIIRRTQ